MAPSFPFEFISAIALWKRVSALVILDEMLGNYLHRPHTSKGVGTPRLWFGKRKYCAPDLNLICWYGLTAEVWTPIEGFAIVKKRSSFALFFYCNRDMGQAKGKEYFVYFCPVWIRNLRKEKPFTTSHLVTGYSLWQEFYGVSSVISTTLIKNVPNF